MVLFYAKNHPEMIPKSNVFSSIVSQKVAAHSFLPPGYPGGIEGYFSPKTSTFSDHRKEVIKWRYFGSRKPATTR